MLHAHLVCSLNSQQFCHQFQHPHGASSPLKATRFTIPHFPCALASFCPACCASTTYSVSLSKNNSVCKPTSELPAYLHVLKKRLSYLSHFHGAQYCHSSLVLGRLRIAYSLALQKLRTRQSCSLPHQAVLKRRLLRLPVRVDDIDRRLPLWLQC